MLYMNQLEYRHIPYNHNVANGGVPEERRCVATSGCGLCSCCMIVDQLTMESLGIEECVTLSENGGANLGIGTDMRVLGPIIAKTYNLDYAESSDKDEASRWLRKGGKIIALVKGDSDGNIGPFSRVAHFITLISVDGDEVCFLDPSYKEGKYERPGREGIVRDAFPFLYTKLDTVFENGANTRPIFYMFNHK